MPASDKTHVATRPPPLVTTMASTITGAVLLLAAGASLEGWPAMSSKL
jgi:hypothetical protein